MAEPQRCPDPPPGREVPAEAVRAREVDGDDQAEAQVPRRVTEVVRE